MTAHLLLAMAFAGLALAGSASNEAGYDRGAWPHWERAGECDVRHAVLLRDATEAVVNSARPCRVAAGKWVDPYAGTVVGHPGGIDVDHLVPLRWVHQNGGATWPLERKRAYANDLGYRWHLAAVDRRQNRAKGARGPAGWAPAGAAARCDYAHRWAAVLISWDLRPGEEDRAAIRALLRGCR